MKYLIFGVLAPVFPDNYRKGQEQSSENPILFSLPDISGLKGIIGFSTFEVTSKVLRLAAFNVYSHNWDDHSKNISFLMNSTGVWKLAPAYYLTFSNSSHGMRSTMAAGESKASDQKHLLELVIIFGVKNPKTIIEEVSTAIADWESYAKNSSVSANSKKLIAKTLMEIGKGSHTVCDRFLLNKW